MNNKKTLWLGLVAILSIMPILVVNLAISPGAQPETASPASLPLVGEPLPLLHPPQRQEPKQASNVGRAVVVDFETPGSSQSLSFPQDTAPSRTIPMGHAVGKIQLLALASEPKNPATEPVQPPNTAPGPLSDFVREEKLGAQPAGTGGGVPAAQVSGPSTSGASGVGDLLTKSNSALGVEVQKRSPLVGDPRIEGLHFGQIVTQADGGYWFPARVDLDSVISKINSSNIDNIIIIKGPFSVRYGPGFSFLDIESLPTPRNKDGFDVKGSTSVNYRTNGQGWQGQQSLWGGNADWGFRISYDLQSAGDYVTGNGTKLPSSYNNQFFNFAFGMDLSSNSSIEVKYLHVQQSNVLFPGLLTDINSLTTDAFTARYKATEGGWYDQLTLDTWVNTTKFNGDSANPETRAQVPQLDNIFPNLTPQFRPVRLDINTDGYAISFGLRETTTWGDVKGFNVSLGADVKVFQSNYNEFDAFNLSTKLGTGLPGNLGIPNARQIDPGIFVDSSIPLGESLLLKVGARVDFVTTQFLGFGPNTDVGIYMEPNNVGNPQGEKDFFLFSGFLTAEYKLSKEWTTQAGYGYAQRPPTLTELYTGGAFLGLVQNGLNSIYGTPDLRKEEIHQFNAGIKGKYEDVRVGASAFYGFLPNYITYQNQGNFIVASRDPAIPNGVSEINRLKFINTNLATLYGFDAYGEYDALPWLTPFATMSFVEGFDQTRGEALPGIPPLSSRVGVRIHDPSKEQKWGVEYFVRMVAPQNLFAGSLGENSTPGFAVHNVRAYWQATTNILLLAGVENLGNLQYQEHLDLRTGGVGVFQPGINFYFGVKATY